MINSAVELYCFKMNVNFCIISIADSLMPDTFVSRLLLAVFYSCII